MIRDFLVRHAVAELWEVIWHLGIIACIALAGALWAYFSPIHKKTGVWVCGVALFVLFTSAYFTKTGADYVRAKWEAAEAAAVNLGAKARTDAERSVAGRGVRPDDPDNRDHDKGAVRPVEKNKVFRKPRQ